MGRSLLYYGIAGEAECQSKHSDEEVAQDCARAIFAEEWYAEDDTTSPVHEKYGVCGVDEEDVFIKVA